MDTGGRTATLGDVATYFGGGCGAAASYFWSTPAFAYDEITVVGYPEFPTSPEFCLCFVCVLFVFCLCFVCVLFVFCLCFVCVLFVFVLCFVQLK